MNHNSNTNYEYVQSLNYYMEEEPEEYGEGYSDSDVLMTEKPQYLDPETCPDITEIYSRNCQTIPPRHVKKNETRYLHTQNLKQYNHQPCFCEALVQQIPRTHTAIPLENYIQIYNPGLHQYCPISTASQHDANNYDTLGYRTGHVHSVSAVPSKHAKHYPENIKAPMAQKPQNSKRYPVTVGTPKYYRKQPANSVVKRPSTLSLPVATQPDPAVCRRHKKTSYVELLPPTTQQVQNNAFSIEAPQMTGCSKASKQTLEAHVMDSEGDVNVNISNLEDMLSRFENENQMAKFQDKNDIAKFVRFLKPRVPPSIKTRQEKINRPTKETSDTKLQGSNSKQKISTSEANDEAPDSLEKLLNQLKKCELAVDEASGKQDEERQKKNEKYEKEGSVKESGKSKKNNEDKCKKPKSQDEGTSPSYNYHDISTQMMRSKSDSLEFTDEEKQVDSLNSITYRSKSSGGKPILDDHCALELHRSKSYIVNLIDRALSKELGTVPGERRKKEFVGSTSKRSTDLNTCGKSDKEICLEITSALTDSIISNATAPEPHSSSSTSTNKTKVCCNCNAEEPTYIKQLKQLRWGHLKHIQREVRRLEDLERFLDSCSSSNVPEL